MPGNGANLLWDQTAPADSNNAGAGAGEIRSLKTSLENGLAVEHNWPTATGPNFGYHLLGSGRAYYGPESNVSSSGTDGRLMVTSDTSRFYHVGSGGTMFLGTSQGLEFFGFNEVYPTQQHYWRCESGTGITDGSGNLGIAFSGYSGIPFVWCQPVPSTATPYATMGLALAVPDSLTPTSGVIRCAHANSGLVFPGVPIRFFSIGTRIS